MPLGWAVTDPFRSPYRGFIQTMSQAADHALNFQMAGGAEDDLQQHLSFDAQFPCFVGVNRPGLINDLHRLQHSLGGKLAVVPAAFSW